MKKLFIGYYDYPYVMTAYEYNGEIMTGLVPVDLDKDVLKAVNEYIDEDFGQPWSIYDPDDSEERQHLIHVNKIVNHLLNSYVEIIVCNNGVYEKLVKKDVNFDEQPNDKDSATVDHQI